MHPARGARDIDPGLYILSCRSARVRAAVWFGTPSHRSANSTHTGKQVPLGQGLYQQGQYICIYAYNMQICIYVNKYMDRNVSSWFL